MWEIGFNWDLINLSNLAHMRENIRLKIEKNNPTLDK